MCLDPLWLPAIKRSPFNAPGDRLAQRLAHDRATGLANGRQRLLRPRMHTALSQLSHQQTVHQQDEVEMARLPLAAAQLTIPQAQMLLTVSMQGLCPCPASAIPAQHSGYFPRLSIGEQ